MNIGKLGVWALINEFTSAESAAFAKRVEAWGYSTLWLPEAFGREPLVSASWLLAHTSHLQVATGIMNIYARDSLTALNGQYGLAEQSNGRFLLGLGASHQLLVEGLRGHQYQKPLATMHNYLEALQQHKEKLNYKGPQPREQPLTVIAALGPKMLKLAATMADGVHSYNVSPDHTAQAREILGPNKLLIPEQKIIFEKNPSIARRIGRMIIGHSINLPAYRNNFLRMGFTEEDFADGGSNRLIDGLIAWGDEEHIRQRIQQHWDAGADQVCLQVLAKEGMKISAEDEKILELLAPEFS